MSVEPAVAPPPRRPSPAAAGARLGELYAAHARLVYGISLMLLRDADEAEDATQQVFLAAYRSLLAGTDVRDPAAWLGTIARNACRRRSVARMREPLTVADPPTIVSPAAEETAIGREEAAAVYAQLAALPAKQREAVVLRDLYGLRYDEVAKALGTSRPAVESLLFRGRRQIKRRLRPGVAAGVLAVPVAVQESIAYAVPGFAGATAPAGAAAAAAGIPLVAKLATAGAAVALAGSAGVVAQRGLHDPPPRPVAKVQSEAPANSAPAVRRPPVPAARFTVVETQADRSGSGSGGDDQAPRAAGNDDEPSPEQSRDESRGGPHRADRRDDDKSVPGSGSVDPVREPAVDDRSGPGEGTEPVDNRGRSSSGSGSGNTTTESGSSGSGSGSETGGSGDSGGSGGAGSGGTDGSESGRGGEGPG